MQGCSSSPRFYQLFEGGQKQKNKPNTKKLTKMGGNIAEPLHIGIDAILVERAKKLTDLCRTGAFALRSYYYICVDNHQTLGWTNNM